MLTLLRDEGNVEDLKRSLDGPPIRGTTRKRPRLRAEAVRTHVAKHRGELEIWWGKGQRFRRS